MLSFVVERRVWWEVVVRRRGGEGLAISKRYKSQSKHPFLPPLSDALRYNRESIRGPSLKPNNHSFATARTLAASVLLVVSHCLRATMSAPDRPRSRLFLDLLL